VKVGGTVYSKLMHANNTEDPKVKQMVKITLNPSLKQEAKEVRQVESEGEDDQVGGKSSPRSPQTSSPTTTPTTTQSSSGSSSSTSSTSTSSASTSETAELESARRTVDQKAQEMAKVLKEEDLNTFMKAFAEKVYAKMKEKDGEVEKRESRVGNHCSNSHASELSEELAKILRVSTFEEKFSIVDQGRMEDPEYWEGRKKTWEWMKDTLTGENPEKQLFCCHILQTTDKYDVAQLFANVCEHVEIDDLGSFRSGWKISSLQLQK
jgi:hypothetical protein